MGNEVSAIMSSTYYFMFGYHAPHDLAVVVADPDFDCESTGLFPIAAESAAEALEWGQTLAEWYINNLFENGEYSWTASNYANWIESDFAEDSEEWVKGLDTVAVGLYPNFVAFKAAFGD